jgi:C-terminal processing protease CtpA/Prc
VTVQAQNSKYVYDEETGYGNIVEDIVVLDVASGSIALSLGLQISDVITKIEYGGKVHGLNRYFDIADHLLHLTSGVSFRFIYERGGVEKQTPYYTIKASDLSVVA